MITAIIVVLKGSGVLKQLPDYVIWALVLFTLVAGILGGICSLGGRSRWQYSVLTIYLVESVSQTPNPETLISSIFASVVGLTIAVYLLRGFGILTFIPGGVIWILILLSIASGITYGVQRTRR
ncbi:hypothetical protein NC997_13080 [Trichocoleus sp. DQ-A2]|nr:MULTISPECIES: hypothetical protein [unclassified Coleofasciculus]